MPAAGREAVRPHGCLVPRAGQTEVAHLRASLGMSERRACNIIVADQASVRYRSWRGDDTGLRDRLHILLLRVNCKKTQRFHAEEGLTVRRRKSRRRAADARAPQLVAAQPNQRWSLNFVHDQLVSGRRFRVLNVESRGSPDVVDDVTRKCLAAVVDTLILGRRVTRELAALHRGTRQTGDDRQ